MTTRISVTVPKSDPDRERRQLVDVAHQLPDYERKRIVTSATGPYLEFTIPTSSNETRLSASTVQTIRTALPAGEIEMQFSDP